MALDIYAGKHVLYKYGNSGWLVGTLQAFPLDDWVKDYPQYYMTKEDYITLTESEDFERARENAYFTDGEYVYYPVSKFSKSWIEKQPFKYIVRSE